MSGSEITETYSTRIDIVIPILNEGLTLHRTLESIANQDYPKHLLEVSILDGGSTDSWGECLGLLRAAGVAHRVIPNPNRTVSFGVNLALRATSADAILWLSGHCSLATGYIRTLVAVYERYEDAVIGGRVRATGSNLQGVLNALVLRSTFGTGMASWRTQATTGWAKSATYALYPRQLLLDAGALNERLVRNQDTELVKRLAGQGVRFYVADTEALYLAPRRLSGLLRKAWGNGAWGIWSWRVGLRAFSAFHLVPGASVATGTALAVTGIWNSSAWYILIALIVLYCVLATAAAVVVAANDRKVWLAPLLVLWFAVHHLAYGFGTIAGVVLRVPVMSPLAATHVNASTTPEKVERKIRTP